MAILVACTTTHTNEYITATYTNKLAAAAANVVAFATTQISFVCTQTCTKQKRTVTQLEYIAITRLGVPFQIKFVS